MTADNPAVTPILLPQAGQTMEEGTIVQWHVAEGDRIEVGQVIFEVETDKAAVEIEADQAGRLAKIVVSEGETIPVKTPVAYLSEDDQAVETYLASKSQDAVSTQATSSAKQSPPPPKAVASDRSIAESTATPAGRIKASPAARKIARETGADLTAAAPGSGPGGRVLSSDLAAMQPGPTEDTRMPLSRMRRAIARNLQASKQTVPHFYMKLTVDAGPLFARYRQCKEAHGVRLNDLVLRAVALTCRAHPAFRSRIDGEEILTLDAVHLGLAVGTDDGLRVPVLANADRIPLAGLAEESSRLVQAARDGRLDAAPPPAAMTVTNLGMFGVEEFSAIINPPEAAILAVGAAREDVIVRDGAIRAGQTMTLTLSCDHRVIDGLAAARFLATLRETLENPDALA